MPRELLTFIVLGGILIVGVIAFATIGRNYNLNRIKSKTVGDGQYGTARFASAKEISQTYQTVSYEPEKWRQGINLPIDQGLIVGGFGRDKRMKAYVDTDDIHAMMVATAGAGKTAYFLYPNLEYACASGMSFVTTDTKGDLYRNYAKIAEKYYGYNVSVIDLRNPAQSHGNNMLHLVNVYMDRYLKDNDDIQAKAKAEKYAKILAKTIIQNGSEGSVSYGQNAFFYDSAEGLLTATILLVSEFSQDPKRHIISVFKVIQDLLAPVDKGEQTEFQKLMNLLPDNHKTKWFAGAALNTANQAAMSVLSTALSKLNAFIDTELEQIVCFDTVIDAEKFCNQKSAIFLCLPEEDGTKHFLISLIIQQLYREILTVADDQGGTLKNRVMFYLDEIGTIPRIESIELMFSASRSRKVSIVAILQSLAQLEKNYGKEGSAIIIDNCQDTIMGGFAPNSEGARIFSENLGTKTVMSGSVNHGKSDPSQSLQMIQRPLMTTDELKALKKGEFVISKTGSYPMRSELRLFERWGIKLDKLYQISRKAVRVPEYATKQEIEDSILQQYPNEKKDQKPIRVKLLKPELKQVIGGDKQ
ncbi:type IV secretory system conjugative DNA transfer family protein [Erysipelothrix rhusiopathiae]|nr:type IV secretory system conjugative DNA transfer family protein [Erysipelothrix rhusiopathiae]